MTTQCCSLIEAHSNASIRSYILNLLALGDASDHRDGQQSFSELDTLNQFNTTTPSNEGFTHRLKYCRQHKELKNDVFTSKAVLPFSVSTSRSLPYFAPSTRLHIELTRHDEASGFDYMCSYVDKVPGKELTIKMSEISLLVRQVTLLPSLNDHLFHIWRTSGHLTLKYHRIVTVSWVSWALVCHSSPRTP